MARLRLNGLHVQLVVAKISLCVVEDLTSDLHAIERGMGVPWHDRGIVDEIQESTGVFGQDDLFLGALDGGCELKVVGLLEFLPCLVHVSTHLLDDTDSLTMLLSCASATRL
jgi:hypothetical protein